MTEWSNRCFVNKDVVLCKTFLILLILLFITFELIVSLFNMCRHAGKKK